MLTSKRKVYAIKYLDWEFYWRCEWI